MDKCRHVWHSPSDNLRICILCRCIVDVVHMKQMSQEEFEKLYPPPNSEVGPIIFNDAPDFIPEKTKEHAKATIQKWAEYFESNKNKQKTENSESDWEPLHIGFRDDD